jgi:hypothetical protein
VVVRAARGAVGEDEGGLTAAARPAAALGVVRRGRRDVAHVDDVELGDVDAELHGRGTEQERQLGLAEAGLTAFALVGADLGRVLVGMQHVQVASVGAVEVDKEGIGAQTLVGRLRHADGVVRGGFTVTAVPDHLLGLELIGGGAAAATTDLDLMQRSLGEDAEHLLDDGGGVDEGELAEGAEDIGATEVLAEAAARGDIDEPAAVGARLVTGAGGAAGGDGMEVLDEPLGVAEAPGVDEKLVGVEANLLLRGGLEELDLDRQLAAEIIEEDLADRSTQGGPRGDEQRLFP